MKGLETSSGVLSNKKYDLLFYSKDSIVRTKVLCRKALLLQQKFTIF